MDERDDLKLEGEHKEEEQWYTVQDEAPERNWEENWPGGTSEHTNQPGTRQCLRVQIELSSNTPVCDKTNQKYKRRRRVYPSPKKPAE